jgi:hypothetical protein
MILPKVKKILHVIFKILFIFLRLVFIIFLLYCIYIFLALWALAIVSSFKWVINIDLVIGIIFIFVLFWWLLFITITAIYITVIGRVPFLNSKIESKIKQYNNYKTK